MLQGALPVGGRKKDDRGLHGSLINYAIQDRQIYILRKLKFANRKIAFLKTF